MEAVRSFRNHVENRTNTPSTDYSKNISGLSDNQILQLVIFLNQWSVYVIDSVASKRILRQALSHELLMYLYSLLPSADRIKDNYNINGYYQLLNIITKQWYNPNKKGEDTDEKN